VLQSKCFRLATVALWYVSNRQIHEERVFVLFAVQIRALTLGFGSKLGDLRNPILQQVVSYLR